MGDGPVADSPCRRRTCDSSMQPAGNARGSSIHQHIVNMLPCQSCTSTPPAVTNGLHLWLELRDLISALQQHNREIKSACPTVFDVHSGLLAEPTHSLSLPTDLQKGQDGLCLGLFVLHSRNSAGPLARYVTHDCLYSLLSCAQSCTLSAAANVVRPRAAMGGSTPGVS
jgi:hypothetical protein